MEKTCDPERSRQGLLEGDLREGRHSEAGLFGVIADATEDLNGL